MNTSIYKYVYRYVDLKKNEKNVEETFLSASTTNTKDLLTLVFLYVFVYFI